MEYGSENFLRDLMKIWASTASDDDESSLNFFLLSIMQDEGVKGVLALIQSLDQTRLGKVEITDNRDNVVIRMSRLGFNPLVLKAGDDDVSPWVDVCIESDTTSIAVKDPRHAAFYSIWENLLNREHTSTKLRSAEENVVYLMALLEAEVMNGGIGQYLTNTEGIHLSETFSCLEKIGAIKTHTLLKAAVELASGFDSYIDAWDEKSESYSRLDTEFLESGENLAALTTDIFLRS